MFANEFQTSHESFHQLQQKVYAQSVVGTCFDRATSFLSLACCCHRLIIRRSLHSPFAQVKRAQPQSETEAKSQSGWSIDTTQEFNTANSTVTHPIEMRLLHISTFAFAPTCPRSVFTQLRATRDQQTQSTNVQGRPVIYELLRKCRFITRLCIFYASFGILLK